MITRKKVARRGYSSQPDGSFGLVASTPLQRDPEATGVRIGFARPVAGAYAPSRRIACMVFAKPRMLRTRLKVSVQPRHLDAAQLSCGYSAAGFALTAAMHSTRLSTASSKDFSASVRTFSRSCSPR